MRLLLAVAAGVLGYCYYRGLERRAHPLPREDLHRWEGEGGNVPSVATPSPSPSPLPASLAAGDSAIRH